MRPAHSFIKSLLSHSASVDQALIAWGTFRYNRQEMPISRFRGSSETAQFEHMFTREAAMGSQPPQSDDHSADETLNSSKADESTTPESRAERLARIKAEINAGTYDTEEKMDLAIDRMIGRHF